MAYEPDKQYHYIFQTLSEAMEAWIELSPELREMTESPRQVLPNVWVFDKPTELPFELTFEPESSPDNAEIE